MKYTPMRRKGKRGVENDKIRATVWPAVLRRAYGPGGVMYCEGCKTMGGVEWAHLFGRPGSGFCLGPMANSAELTAALCRVCHNAVDRHTNDALTLRLRQDGMRRFITTIGGYIGADLWLDPEAIRVLVAKTEEQGWVFDEQRCQIVQQS